LTEHLLKIRPFSVELEYESVYFNIKTVLVISFIYKLVVVQSYIQKCKAIKIAKRTKSFYGSFPFLSARNCVPNCSRIFIFKIFGGRR
jgi:hypothetical protein